MRSLVALSLLLLASCNPCFSQEVKVSEVSVITGLIAPQVAGSYVLTDKTSKPVFVPGRLVEVASTAANIEVEALYNGTIVDGGQINANSFIIPSISKMTLRIRCVDFDQKIYQKKTIELGGIEPLPPPTPDPPVPPPTPTPDKIDNLTVLIVYESGQLSAYKEAHRTVIQSTLLRAWMDSNLPKDAQNLSNWRVLDKDTKFPVSSDLVYKKWLLTPPNKLPYLIVGNKDVIVYQGELPTDIEEVKAIITKYKK